MTVRADNFTLLYLSFSLGNAVLRKARYVCQFLSAHMVKIKHYDVLLTAVYTRMLCQVSCNELSHGHANSLVVPLNCGSMLR